MSMRKTAKRLFAALAALVMAFAVVTPAFAAEGTGTITITNATVGESYAGYKVFDVTYTEENSDVSYRIYDDNQFFNAINGEGSPFTLTESAVDGVYNVAVNEGVTDEQIITWLSGLVGEGSFYTADLDPTQATSATVSWTNVPYGYYLITSSLGSVVTIDKNNPNAEIVDKNQQPGTDFEKAVDGTDEVMQIGVPFTFTLSFDATNYDGENAIEKYTVSDTFPEGMDLVEGENNVTIKINDGTEYTLYETVTLDENNSFRYGLYVTDTNGRVDIEDLPYGSYILKEYRAPEGYEKFQEYHFTIQPETPVEDGFHVIALEAKDAHKKGSVTIIKSDDIGNQIKDIEFTLYDQENHEVGKAVTNEAGVAKIDGLKWGSYILKETDAPDYYEIDEEGRPVEITASNLDIQLTIVNATQKGSVVMTKYDETETDKLEGAVASEGAVDGYPVGADEVAWLSGGYGHRALADVVAGAWVGQLEDGDAFLVADLVEAVVEGDLAATANNGEVGVSPDLFGDDDGGVHDLSVIRG